MNPARLLGQETSFQELVGGLLTDDMRSRFTRFKSETVLDIGCGSGFSLWMLYYTFGVRGLFGFDRSSPHKILERDNKFRGTKHKCLEELWLSVFNEEAPGDVIPPITTIEGYIGIAQIEFQTTEPHANWPAKFDIVVCSNMLHFSRSVSQADEYLRMIADRMREGALVYISVKDGYWLNQRDVVDGPVLFELCREFSIQHGLVHHPGVLTDTEGYYHAFTNL